MNLAEKMRGLEKLQIVEWSDGTIGWTDLGKATSYDEQTYSVGDLELSVNTRKRNQHEELWQTESGAWILHSWTYHRSAETRWEVITDKAGQGWLLRNRHFADVSESYLESYKL